MRELASSRAIGDQWERDLVAAMRAELAAVEPARACCRAAEAAGLGAQATGRASTPAVARLAVRLASVGDRPLVAFDIASAADHCRLAYLRGAFLARGSLSLTAGRIHLEFVLPHEDAPAFAALLDEIGLPAAWRERRGRGVVTWKNAESVVTFLRRAGASASMLELESRLVTRTLHGQLNRVINAEASNLRRSVVSAVRQAAAIEQLSRDGRLPMLPASVRAIARARLDAPEATYTELAAVVGASRPSVQRALSRLMSLALLPADPVRDAGHGRGPDGARAAPR
jgi:DNA-binding protein WhiA